MQRNNFERWRDPSRPLIWDRVLGKPGRRAQTDAAMPLPARLGPVRNNKDRCCQGASARVSAISTVVVLGIAMALRTTFSAQLRSKLASPWTQHSSARVSPRIPRLLPSSWRLPPRFPGPAQVHRGFNLAALLKLQPGKGKDLLNQGSMRSSRLHSFHGVGFTAPRQLQRDDNRVSGERSSCEMSAKSSCCCALGTEFDRPCGRSHALSPRVHRFSRDRRRCAHRKVTRGNPARGRL